MSRMTTVLPPDPPAHKMPPHDGARSGLRAIEPPPDVDVSSPGATLIAAEAVSVFYGDFEAIKKVSLTIPQNRVVAFIGPSGCGKSTFLRSINRLNDLIPGCRVSGRLVI